MSGSTGRALRGKSVLNQGGLEGTSWEEGVRWGRAKQQCAKLVFVGGMGLYQVEEFSVYVSEFVCIAF